MIVEKGGCGIEMILLLQFEIKYAFTLLFFEILKSVSLEDARELYLY